MSDEIKTEEKECKCLCNSKGFKKFLTIALGTFVGVFCALSLFAALHKPPMMVPMRPFGPQCGCPCHRMHMHKDFGKFNKNPEFQKRFLNEQGKRTPFEPPVQNAK